MPKAIMELTEEERIAILRLRRERMEKAQPIAVRLLKTAADYAEWLHSNGAGDTYSTFCDDFGYEPQPGEDRPATHAAVIAILHGAGELALERIK